MASTMFSIQRADDALSLDVELVDLDILPAGDGWQVRAAGQIGAIVVTTSAQHLVEYADKVDPKAPIVNQPRPIFARPSRLTFVVPPGTSFPLSVAGVLEAITPLELVPDPKAVVFDPVADPLDTARGDGSVLSERRRRAAALSPVAGPTSARAPAGATSAAVLAELNPSVVAAPARLLLAVPGGAARFVHASSPVEREGAVEQWHTRLGLRTATEQSPPQEVTTKVRVVQALEPGGPPVPGPGYLALVSEENINNALTGQHARDIRVQSNTPNGELDLAHLRLSPLGATLDLDGSWATGNPASYRHRTLAGRDEEVRVAVRGIIFPFGHRATLTTTTRRDLRSGRDGDFAVLKTKSVLTIRERVKEYVDADRPGRSWPWQRVEILNTVSPPGDIVHHTVFGTPVESFQHLDVAGRPFATTCRVTDRAGHVTAFALPQLFLPDGQNSALATILWRSLDPVFRTLQLGGQPVGLASAPSGAAARDGSGSADATTVLAHSAALDVAVVGGQPFPTVESFVGTSPVLNGLTLPVPTTIRYAEQFLASGFGDGNPGELLLTLAGPATELGKEAAGLVTASFPVRAISRSLGAVASNATTEAGVLADLAEVAAARFDPRRWIEGLGDTKLFGVFPLGELLPPAGTMSLLDAPRQTAELIDGEKSFTATWNSDLLRADKSFAVGPALLKTEPGKPVHLLIDHVTSFDPSSKQVRSRTVSEVTGAVLALSLAGEDLISLPVPTIRFESVDGAAPTVHVEVGRVDFLGPLAWVGRLARLLDGAGLGRPDARRGAARAGTAAGGPTVEVFDDRIEASLTLAIPDFAVGVFSLSDIVFRSSFELFFSDKPTLTLAFSSQEHPFHCTVSALGGGGFFLVRMSMAGLEAVRGALEFGAAVAVNLAGIARGSASVMGGIYFELLGDKVSLAGYVRMRGHMDILGLISTSVECSVVVAWEPSSGLVEGTAMVSVSIKMLFLKKTVSFEVRHEFAGSNGDPTFAELMAPPGRPGARPWDTYCDAFLAA